MSIRTAFTMAVLAVAFAARAQTQPPAQQQPQQPANAPQQQPGQGTTTPQGSPGQGAGAPQPSSPGTASGSQQVVVNPPAQPAAPGAPAAAPPPPPANAPPASPPPERIMVVERRPEPNPLQTVAVDAAYGGLAGLLVGTGFTLVDQWHSWQRDMTVGTGIGVLAGAAVGGVQAWMDARDREARRARSVAYARSSLVGFDGMNRTNVDPVVAGWTARLTFHF